MYIFNAKSSKNKWLYIVLPLLFFLLMLGNYDPKNSEKMIQESIAKMGELPFLVMNMMIFALLFWGLWAVVKYFHKQTITSFSTAREKFDFKRFFFAFWVWGIIVSVGVLVEYFSTPNDFVWNFNLIPFLTLTFFSLLLIPFQAGFEEYFFRGYLLQGLGLIIKQKWFPLIFTSVAFGLMHIANPEVSKFGYNFLIIYILMGLSMGIITLMDNGLELSWGMHTSNNIVASLLVTSEWTALQTPSLLKQINTPNFDFTYILSIVFSNMILLYIFAKKYRWTHWKEKLID